MWRVSDLPLTFRRQQTSLSIGLDLLISLGTALGGLLLLISGLVVADAGVPKELGWMAELPTGRVAAAGSLAGLGVITPALGWLWIGRGRRRYGACVVHVDGLCFEKSRRNRGEDLYVGFGQIDRRTITPHGLLVELRGEGRLAALAAPLLIPTDEAGAARLLPLLDEHALAPDQAEERVVALLDRRAEAAVLVAGFAPFAALILLDAGLTGSSWEPTLLSLWSPLAPAVFGFALWRRELAPRLFDLRCRRASVVWGRVRLPTERVAYAACDGEYLLLATPEQWVFARAAGKAEEAKQALAWSGMRCPVQSTLPEWACAPARRRRALRSLIVWTLANGLVAILVLGL